MAKRKIIKIDEEKCNGCGRCIPNCPEGAIQVIGGKARLISDLFCDGLGACIGHCPQGAINIEERQAQEYEERKVIANIVRQGKDVIKAHLKHLNEHGQDRYFQEAVAYLKEKNIEVPLAGEREEAVEMHRDGPSSCPGSKIMDFRKKGALHSRKETPVSRESQLNQWPVQLMLIPPSAPYFQDADILIAADCVPFAYAGFHEDLLKGMILLVGCPKLDDTAIYQKKIIQVLKNNDIKSITYAHMEVPCCFGLVGIIREAISASGKKIPFQETIISIKGERLK